MAKPKGVSIHHHIAEKVELARIYAEDGAFHTAAQILCEAAADMKEHANNCDALLEEYMKG